MTEPTIADKKPARLDLEPGTYHWCACGKSQKQPWCDGSHKGSEFSPIKLEIKEKKSAALYQCKHSNNKSFRDGSHGKL